MKILIAAGCPDLNESLVSFLQNDFEIIAVSQTREECLAAIGGSPGLAIVSQQLPGAADLIEMFYTMRMCDIRIIFLAPLFRAADPLFKRVVDLGVYDVVPGQITLGAILEKLHRPAAFKEAWGLLQTGPEGEADQIRVPTARPLSAPEGSAQLLTAYSPAPAGKTMFAVNLAAVLADAGFAVAVLDLDLGRLAIHRWLKCPPGEAALFDLLQTLKAKEKPADLLNFCYHPREAGGLWVISADPALAPQPVKEKNLAGLLELMAAEVDYIVADIGSLEDAVARMVMSRADHNFLVVSPDFSHLDAVRNYLANGDPPNGWLVLNRLVQSPDLRASDVEQTLARRVDFAIPDAGTVVFESIKGGVPAVYLDPDLKRVFRQVAAAII